MSFGLNWYQRWPGTDSRTYTRRVYPSQVWGHWVSQPVFSYPKREHPALLGENYCHWGKAVFSLENQVQDAEFVLEMLLHVSVLRGVWDCPLDLVVSGAELKISAGALLENLRVTSGGKLNIAELRQNRGLNVMFQSKEVRLKTDPRGLDQQLKIRKG